MISREAEGVDQHLLRLMQQSSGENTRSTVTIWSGRVGFICFKAVSRVREHRRERWRS